MAIFTLATGLRESNVTGLAQYEPGSGVGYTVFLLNHSEQTEIAAAENQNDPRTFGNDVMAGGADNDEMFGQIGDDIMQGDGSIDFQAESEITPYDPSPAVNPSFTIPDNQSVVPTSYFMVQGNHLLTYWFLHQYHPVPYRLLYLQ